MFEIFHFREWLLMINLVKRFTGMGIQILLNESMRSPRERECDQTPLSVYWNSNIIRFGAEMIHGCFHLLSLLANFNADCACSCSKCVCVEVKFYL